MRMISAESEAQKELSQLCKQWLWRYHDAKLEVHRLELDYIELVETQESVGAINYDGMPSGSGGTSDLSGLIIARDNALSRLLRAKNRMAVCYSEIQEAIEKLDEANERNVLSERYLRFTPSLRKREWDDIASTLGYSPQHVKLCHGTALQKLTMIITPAKLKPTKLRLNKTK